MRYNPDMLLRIACGDAWGVACEYIDAGHENFDKVLQFDHYYAHPNWGALKGRYTDDTSMSISCAEVLLGDKPYTSDKFCKSFFDVFKRDPHGGFAQGFQQLLREVKTWEELRNRLHTDSDKNGAAMRACPIGILPDPKEVMDVSRAQAIVTHNTPGGILSAQLVSLITHYSIYDYGPMEKETFFPWLNQFYPKEITDIFQKPWKGPVVGPAVGLKTAHAVIHIVLTEKTLIDGWTACAKAGGDCDSTCAIVGGIMSNRRNEVLPSFFELELETGRLYGVDFLRGLGKKLFDKFYYGSK